MIKNFNNKKFLKDEEIIEKFKNDPDNKLLNELFTRYIHLTYNLCFKYLKNDEACKDAVIEIYEQLINDIKKYEIKHFKNWLYVKTKNYCLNKKNQKNNSKIELLFFEQIDNIFVEFPFFINHSTEEINIIDNNQMETVINKLNAKQKKCIQLFYFENNSYSEISDITGYDIKQVKSHLQNGKRNLKNLILSLK